WATTELTGISVIIFASNRAWRASYDAADEAKRASLRTMLEGWSAVWDGMFFLLLVAFLLGSLLFGAAAVRQKGLARAVGVLLLAAVPLTAFIMAGGYAGVAWANTLSDAVY